MITLAEAGIRINHNSKYLRFVRWFRRGGWLHEELGWRAFCYGYRLGYKAAQRRAQPQSENSTEER